MGVKAYFGVICSFKILHSAALYLHLPFTFPVLRGRCSIQFVAKIGYMWHVHVGAGWWANHYKGCEVVTFKVISSQLIHLKYNLMALTWPWPCQTFSGLALPYYNCQVDIFHSLVRHQINVRNVKLLLNIGRLWQIYWNWIIGKLKRHSFIIMWLLKQ